MALVAFANELLVALAPSMTTGKDASTAEAPLFTDILTDAETSMSLEEENTPAPQKQDPPVWMLMPTAHAFPVAVPEPPKAPEPVNEVAESTSRIGEHKLPVATPETLPAQPELARPGEVAFSEHLKEDDTPAVEVDVQAAATDPAADLPSAPTPDPEADIKRAVPSAPVSGSEAWAPPSRIKAPEPERKRAAALLDPADCGLQPTPIHREQSLPRQELPIPPDAPTARTPANPQPTTSIQRLVERAEPSPVQPIPTRIAFDALIRPEPPQENIADKAPALQPDAPVARAAAIKADMAGSQGSSGDAEPFEEQPRPAMDAPPRQSAIPAALLTHHSVVHERSAPSTPPETAQAPRTTFIDIEPKGMPATPSGPLKHMEVRIPNAQGNVVVQVLEQKGAMQVTVRTDDHRAAGDIATHLPELTHELKQQGFRAETWTPQTWIDQARQGSTAKESTYAGNSDTEHRHTGRESDEPDHRRKRPPQEDAEEYL
jgi:hypothetical protein